MYKTVFQNSKAALAFAAMTVFGAVSMVGTPEDRGVVTKAADMLASGRQSFASEAEAFAKGQSHGDEVSPPTVFGDYTPADTAVAKAPAAPVTTVAPKGPLPPGHNLMTAPLSPNAVLLDSGQVGEAVITEREMTLTPE